ncbi:MAG: SemiSWEET family transporter [Patescibacteria group bacterium]|jgi:uncharacterized protein with PQ loop repeat
MFSKYPAGLIGAIGTLIYIFVGLPMQMYVIWSTGSVESLSIVPLIVGAFSGTNYCMHGYTNRDWAVMIPQIPNVAFTLIIVGQCVYYR